MGKLRKELDISNYETLEAMREVEQMRKNICLGKSYTDVDEMMTDLLGHNPEISTYPAISTSPAVKKANIESIKFMIETLGASESQILKNKNFSEEMYEAALAELADEENFLKNYRKLSRDQQIKICSYLRILSSGTQEQEAQFIKDNFMIK